MGATIVKKLRAACNKRHVVLELEKSKHTTEYIDYVCGHCCALFPYVPDPVREGGSNCRCYKFACSHCRAAYSVICAGKNGKCSFDDTTTTAGSEEAGEENGEPEKVDGSRSSGDGGC